MSPPSENRDAVERRERLAHARAARARRHPGLGLLLISFGVAIWIVDVLVFVVLRLKSVLLGMVPAAISIPVIAVSVALVTLGRRMRIGDAERVLTGDTRAPIVYLRPFGADSAKITKRMSSRVRISPRERIEKTYEERLARARCARSDRSSPSATRRSVCRCSARRACTRPTRTGRRRSTS